MSRKLRAVLLFLSVAAFYLVCSIRLFNLQIVDSEEYKFFAERQQKETKKVEGERGLIFDRNGETLAYNELIANFYVDLRMLKEQNKNKIAEKFSEVFNKPKSHYLNLLNSSGKIVFLEKNAPKEKALEIKKSLELDELGSVETYKRKYVFGELASHIIGYVNEKNVGIEGIENYYNEVLSGKDGYIVYYRDVKRRVVSVIEKESFPAKKGNDLYLTIDRKIQFIVEEELKNAVASLKAKGGIAALMDVETGEIIALAVYPSYNLNEYNKYENSIRRNKALTDTYEPGSTFKTFVMASALEEKKVNPEENIFCENGSYIYHKLKIVDVKKLGNIQLREAFEFSSNIAMAKISERLDEQTFYRRLRDFGFGNYTRIDLPGEANGMLKSPSSFGKTTKAFMAFGYEVGVTPIQLLTAFCSVVNGGYLREPKTALKIVEPSGKVLSENESRVVRRTISKSTSDIMISLLRGVVERGTATEANSKYVSIIGKTGTSQQLLDGSYSKSNYYASFLGSFPAEKPKLAGIILLDSPQLEKYGGKAAAPVFRKIAERIVELYPDQFNKLTVDHKLAISFSNSIDEGRLTEANENKKKYVSSENVKSGKKQKNNYGYIARDF